MAGGSGSGAARAKKVAKRSPKQSAGKAASSRKLHTLDAEAAETLAARTSQQSEKLYGAARSLHDDVAPLLATAGLKLQLLEFDSAHETGPIDEVLELLGDAMERIRRLSQDLYASTVDRIGLRQALLRISEQHPEVQVSYSATAPLPARIAGQIFEAGLSAIEAALAADASQIHVSATGKAGLHLKITDDTGVEGRSRALAIPQLLARQAGIEVGIDPAADSKIGTIVSIRYASRRPHR